MRRLPRSAPSQRPARTPRRPKPRAAAAVPADRPLLLQLQASCRVAATWRLGPTRDPCTATNGTLFDHLVGLGEQQRRYGQPDRPGALEIDDQLELAGLHHR